MRTKKNLSEKTLALLAATAMGVVISFGATSTHAGFQWVPPTEQETGEETPAPQNADAPPAAAVAVPPAEAIILPLPGEEKIPVAVPAPAATPQQPARQSLQLPPGYHGQDAVLPPPATANTLKVKTVTPAAPQPIAPAPQPIAPAPQAHQQPAATPLTKETAGATFIHVDQQPTPLLQQNAIPVPVHAEPAPAPVIVTTTKVIMPEDAPVTAIEHTPNSERLTVNPAPLPVQQQQQAPQAAPVVIAVPPAQQPAITAAPAAAPAATNFPSIEGFGSDMPLALALQQVVPADYAYAFGDNVNPGQTVSWDGGKPWDQVVNDMLAPHSLKAIIVGKVVHIRQGVHHEGLQRQGALGPEAAPALEAAEIKRININDPGQQSQVQAASLAGIESAAGDAASPAPADAPVAPAPQSADAAIAVPPTAQETPVQDLLASMDNPASVPITEINVEPKTPSPVTEITANVEAPAQKAPVPGGASGLWQAKAGESLKEILTRWSNQAGIELIWSASYDFKIKQDVLIDDSFRTAVETLVSNGIDTEITPGLQVLQNDPKGKIPSLVIRDKVS